METKLVLNTFLFPEYPGTALRSGQHASGYYFLSEPVYKIPRKYQKAKTIILLVFLNWNNNSNSKVGITSFREQENGTSMNTAGDPQGQDSYLRG